MKEDFERIIIYSILKDEKILITLLSSLKAVYFDNEKLSRIFTIVKDYYSKYQSIPEPNVVKSKLNSEEKECLEDLLSMDFDIESSYNWIQDESDQWIKDKAIKQAILDSVELVEKGEYGRIKEKIENALLSGTKVDLGLPYFSSMLDRIKRVWNFREKKIPTGFKYLDKVTNGGLSVPSLSVFLGKISIGKSLALSNLAVNLISQKKNVVIITLEIAQDLIAQRVDGHLTGLNVNEIYQDKEQIKELLRVSKKIRKEGYGEIYIKEYPPATINVNDIKLYLKELDIRKIKYDVIIVDYLNLMKSFAIKDDNLYTSGKKIAEELRALSYYTKCPVITVSQLNREGTFANFEDLDMHHTGESIGIIATADFVVIIAKNQDEMVYEHEISWKVIKNRFGIPGSIWKTYLNPFSLRLYDDIEKYTQSFEISGGTPEIHGGIN